MTKLFSNIKMILLHIAMVFGASFYAQSTIYVTSIENGIADGSSWLNALGDIQSAIDIAVSGDEIWVAEGVYHPGSTVSESIILKNGVSLFGGFQGIETTIDERDWKLYKTSISGDIGEDDVYGGSIWYSGWTINTQNTDVIILAQNVDQSTIIDGFTIEAAYNNGSGSGMTVDNADPIIKNCNFNRNYCYQGKGAGILVTNNSHPQITFCNFIENYGQFSDGVGIAITFGGQVTVVDCDFIGNFGRGVDFVTSVGSGIFNHFNAGPLTVNRCNFLSNTSRHFSLGNQTDKGGAIGNLADGMVINDCSFRFNSSYLGGAIYSLGTAEINNSLFEGNTAISLQSGGEFDYGDVGGAIYTSLTAPEKCVMTNCTIVNNSSGEGALFGTFDLFNCIVWGNIGTGEEVPLIKAQISGDVNIEYSCVQALLETIPNEDPPDPNNYPGSIDQYPVFEDSIGEFRLAIGSPCIDSGNNSLYPLSGSLTDLNDNDRFLDDPIVDDTGSGSSPIIDMGAYEYFDSPIVTLNLKVNLQGPYDSVIGDMTDNLRSNNLIPLSEPYTALGYIHTIGGGEITSNGILGVGGANAVVDWVIVELRDPIDPSIVLASQSVLIQRGGNLIDGTGSNDIIFSLPNIDSVLVAIKHRNHLGVRVLDQQSTNAIIFLDFTDTTLSVFGGANAMNTENGIRVMISGDANGDGTVGAVDKNLEWRVQNGFAFDYIFSKADFNLDGFVNSIDKNAHWRLNNGRSESLE